MSITVQNRDFTTETAVLVALLALSLAYSIVVMQSLTAWVFAWMGVLSVAGSIFVVYLFYRLVVAVEKIADTI